MKKAFVFLFLFIFCFSCAASLAEEPAELTYMDIPWYSTPEEISDALVEAGFIPKFWTLDGLELAESYDLAVPGTEVPEDAGD